MEEHVYKVIQLAGSSEKSMQDAIETAVARAAKTLKHLRWFEVIETRGHIDGARVKLWQVMLKVGFTLEDASAD
jgi:flavin-binding protein dodecin